MNTARRYNFLAIALLTGAIAIFWRLTDASLFLDEAFTLSVGAQSVHQLLRLVASSDNSPPLFHLFTHALEALRLPAWDYRWFVAPFGLVTIAATWGIAQRLFGERAAAVAGLLTATSPLLLDWDRMYRMYAPFVALSMLSWWLLLRIEQGEGKKSVALSIAYVVSAACVPLLHYIGIVVLASQAIYSLVRRAGRVPALAACLVAAAALVAWLPLAREQFARGGSLVLSGAVYWPGVARNLFAAYLPDGAMQAIATYPAIDWIISALVLGIIAAALWIGRGTSLPFMLGPAFVQVGASALPGLAFVNPRYLLYVQPLFAICAGAVTTSAQRWRIAGFAAALLVLGCNVAGSENLLLDPYYQRTDWYAVAALLVTNERPDDAIVLDQGYMHYAVDGLNGFAGHPSFRIESSAAVQDVRAWLRARPTQRVWYVENQFYYPDPARAVVAFLQSTRPVLGTYEQKRASLGDRAVVVLFGAARR